MLLIYSFKLCIYFILFIILLFYEHSYNFKCIKIISLLYFLYHYFRNHIIIALGITNNNYMTLVINAKIHIKENMFLETI